MPDHLGIVDPFTPLVSAADVTTTLRVGQLVINNALHHPVLLARQAATVDLLTDGRLELGLGTGWAQAEHDASGIPLPPPPERVDQFEEALEIITSLLETGAARSDGAYRVAVDDLGVACVQNAAPADPHRRLPTPRPRDRRTPRGDRAADRPDAWTVRAA